VLKRPNNWLRWVGRLALGALFLGTCVVIIRWTAVGRGHAKAQELTNRHRPKTKPGLAATSQPVTGAGFAQKSVDATPIRELPLVGMAFSDDPSVREEFEKLVKELERISRALTETRDKERAIIRSRRGQVINFKTTLENLGIQVPEGMTEAAAAAEFLRHMEKMSGSLAQLRTALEKGKWDWGTPPPFNTWDFGRGRVLQMLDAGGSAAFGLTQARWRTGDEQGAWADWDALRQFALRAGEEGTSAGSYSQYWLQIQLSREVGAGISLDGWTDDQLRRIPQALASYDAVLTEHRSLEVELGRLEEFGQRPADVRAWFESGIPHANGFGPALRRWSFSLASDQQLKDNVAILAADYSYALAQLDPERRVCLPMEGEQTPSQEALADRSFLSDFYFLPAHELMGWSKRGFYGGGPPFAMSGQAITDHARFAAALEVQRRATGQYPDALDAISGSFPEGMPHDVATGQPYLYERTLSGSSYKLWGTGVDRTDDRGDPKKDILFILPVN
jgi:hypothetical protein